jgi:anti-sigma B factor antagonist
VAVCPGSPLVVEIRGEIDIQSAPELRDELLQMIRRWGPEFALDLAGVTFMDCAGLNVLLATRRRAQLEEGSVRVIRASQRVLRLISLLGLEKAFALGCGPGIGASYGTIGRPPWSLSEAPGYRGGAIGMEDHMSDEKHGSPGSGRLAPVEGRPDASAV